MADKVDLSFARELTRAEKERNKQHSTEDNWSKLQRIALKQGFVWNGRHFMKAEDK